MISCVAFIKTNLILKFFIVCYANGWLDLKNHTMKKSSLLILSALLALGFSANAQIQKGNVFVGGNFANLNLGLDEPKIFSVDITPKAAWFVQDNLALGGYVNFGLQTAKNSPQLLVMGLVL
jgi:hypothetical protein